MILAMTNVLPSTFRYLDKHYPVLDDRRNSTAILRHLSVPFTIIADMVVGIAHLVFLGIKGDLSEKFFWEMVHQQFFEYPFQQVVYFFFSTIGTVMFQDYAKGYELGQYAVLNFSFEVYGGRPHIFEHIISHYEAPQYFSNFALNREDQENLQQFIEHTIHFRLSRDNKEIVCDGPFYRLFYERFPYSVDDLEDRYLKKILKMGSCDEKKALNHAKTALEAFYRLPIPLQNHLLQKRKDLL